MINANGIVDGGKNSREWKRERKRKAGDIEPTTMLIYVLMTASLKSSLVLAWEVKPVN